MPNHYNTKFSLFHCFVGAILSNLLAYYYQYIVSPRCLSSSGGDGSGFGSSSLSRSLHSSWRPQSMYISMLMFRECYHMW